LRTDNDGVVRTEDVGVEDGMTLQAVSKDAGRGRRGSARREALIANRQRWCCKDGGCRS
jgi:hypothetical protein